jgi:hypothetical protein
MLNAATPRSAIYSNVFFVRSYKVHESAMKARYTARPRIISFHLLQMECVAFLLEDLLAVSAGREGTGTVVSETRENWNLPLWWKLFESTPFHFVGRIVSSYP